MRQPGARHPVRVDKAEAVEGVWLRVAGGVALHLVVVDGDEVAGGDVRAVAEGEVDVGSAADAHYIALAPVHSESCLLGDCGLTERAGLHARRLLDEAVEERHLRVLVVALPT